MADDEEVPIFMRHPNPDMTPAEFEDFVAAMFVAVEPAVQDFKVTSHEKIEGADGTWDFDATIRFRLLELDYLVLVEAKHHTHPIKREVVELLDSRIRSVGAHKGVVVSTAPFHAGALDFAMAHGIGLVRVTEGRFTVERRSAVPLPEVTGEEVAEYGIETFVAMSYRPAGDGDGDVVGVSHFSANSEAAFLTAIGLQPSG